MGEKKTKEVVLRQILLTCHTHLLRTFDAMPQEGNIGLFFQPTFSSKKADADADADVSKEPPDKQAMGSATISARKAGHNTIMAGKFSATWSEKQNRWNVYHGGTQVTSAVPTVWQSSALRSHSQIGLRP